VLAQLRNSPDHKRVLYARPSLHISGQKDASGIPNRHCQPPCRNLPNSCTRCRSTCGRPTRRDPVPADPASARLDPSQAIAEKGKSNLLHAPSETRHSLSATAISAFQRQPPWPPRQCRSMRRHSTLDAPPDRYLRVCPNRVHPASSHGPAVGHSILIAAAPARTRSISPWTARAVQSSGGMDLPAQRRIGTPSGGTQSCTSP
jgi:hypothetical protein